MFALDLKMAMLYSVGKFHRWAVLGREALFMELAFRFGHKDWGKLLVVDVAR